MANYGAMLMLAVVSLMARGAMGGPMGSSSAYYTTPASYYTTKALEYYTEKKAEYYTTTYAAPSYYTEPIKYYTTKAPEYYTTTSSVSVLHNNVCHSSELLHRGSRLLYHKGPRVLHHNLRLSVILL
ncbi:hypothetical protein GHT06_010638 [Daphnia sinensis]|uniref:Uncharacterized protein n=1 Tax=Daphnia sinensis TaxID=1820382 RepID=A0AAD5LJJ7_9CRUS|nr:hypothetical protein GHT06_010638 [Daphnia sinensis]